MTSGSKGLHLYAALDGKRTYEQVRDYAKEIAEELEKAKPKLVVSQMTKARRGGKVFLDWSQNTGAKTTISPYSLRGRELPMVAAPRTWDEVEAGADDPLALEHLRFEEVLERVQDDGDLFAIDRPRGPRTETSAVPETRRTTCLFAGNACQSTGCPRPIRRNVASTVWNAHPLPIRRSLVVWAATDRPGHPTASVREPDDDPRRSPGARSWAARPQRASAC